MAEKETVACNEDLGKDLEHVEVRVQASAHANFIVYNHELANTWVYRVIAHEVTHSHTILVHEENIQL